MAPLTGSITTHYNTTKPTNLMEKMQAAAHYWEQLLHSSGSKLELSKCFFYHMKWNANAKGVPHPEQISENDNNITITDSKSNTNIHIQALACNKSHKTLGIMESPDGNNTDKYNRLVEKSTIMGRKITTATLSKIDAATLFYTMYLPSITYAFTVGTQSKEKYKV
jgi:hypothetical protein